MSAPPDVNPQTTANITTEKLDARFRLEMQLNRCAETATWNVQSVFDRNVQLAVTMLPIEVKSRVNARNEEWIRYFEKYVKKRLYGVEQGTVEHPVLDHNDEIWSPILEKSEERDFMLLYEIILEELEIAGMSFKRGANVTDFGSVKKNKTKKEKTPT